jgi:hypothetical protein
LIGVKCQLYRGIMTLWIWWVKDEIWISGHFTSVQNMRLSWHEMYGPKVFPLPKVKAEYSDILYNSIHFLGLLGCRIIQVPLYYCRHDLKYIKNLIDETFTWLIDWCLTPTLSVFQLYRGIMTLLYFPLYSVVTTCGFFICYEIILSFFTRFNIYKLQGNYIQICCPCLTPTLSVFQLYRGIMTLWIWWVKDEI